MHSAGTRIRRLAGFTLCLAAAAAVAAAQTASPPAKSFLWKVQSGSKLVYLAGSVHALSADVYPLSPAFERAFAASVTLVEEIDLAEAESLALAPAILAKGMYVDGRRFDNIVSKETAVLVAARLKESGLPVEMFQVMKPWMVMLTIAALEAQKAGLDPNLGLDKHFYDRAKAAGKTIVGLETAESQIDRFDKMSEALQEQLLRSSLSEADTSRNNLKSIVAAWRRGDSAELEKTLLSDFTEYPAAYRSLIVERNHNWIPEIDACLTRPQPCLVVVGAAHLVGPDGLLTLMQRKGYRIEQQ
jgi:uncharacterized protein YbaP (TraB family)